MTDSWKEEPARATAARGRNPPERSMRFFEGSKWSWRHNQSGTCRASVWGGGGGVGRIPLASGDGRPVMSSFCTVEFTIFYTQPAALFFDLCASAFRQLALLSRRFSRTG